MRNILKWDLSYKYWIKHPLKWLREFVTKFKYIWQRATHGYCDSDVFDLSSWLLEVLPCMLRDMSNSEVGAYPGRAPFDTFEKWQTWLRQIASRLENLQENWAENRNEFEDTYMQALHNARIAESDDNIRVTLTYDAMDIRELHDKWLKRIYDLNKEQQEETEKVFEELVKYFYQLWI